MHTSEQLITQYLDVVNAAMQANADHFPWKQIIAKGKDDWNGKNIGVGVTGPDGTAAEAYTITLNSGRWSLVGPGKIDTVYTWEADRAFLGKVAENPQHYIDSPMKINWDWLRSAMNLSNDEEAPRGSSASGGF